MRFGVCGDICIAAAATRASYDFGEWTVAGLLKPRQPEDAFLAGLDEVRSAGLSYPVVNCFVPSDLKITGSDVDPSALRAYVQTTMERAEQAGVKVIVFGSGGARKIPEGFERRIANDQLAAFCGMVAPIAHNHGVTVAVEPLNRADCNVLNTVGECARLVTRVAHPAIRLLVDAYHLMRDGDSYDDIVTHGDLLAHVHIATVPNRLPPGAEPCNFLPFFSALAAARYTGRISIEGRITNPSVELPAALDVMRSTASVAQQRVPGALRCTT